MFIFHACLHTDHAQKLTKLQITAHNPGEQYQALDKIKLELVVQVSLSHAQDNVDKLQHSP